MLGGGEEGGRKGALESREGLIEEQSERLIENRDREKERESSVDRNK